MIAVAKVHSVGVLHHDLGFQNILIDNDGHLILTDFGDSERFSDDDASNEDWNSLCNRCYELFPNPIYDKKQKSVIEMLKTMTDSQLSGNASLC